VDLLTVGEAFEDVIFSGLPRLPRLGEELRGRELSRQPGGGAVITAVAAARLGVKAGTISAMGAMNQAALAAEGVSVVNLIGPRETGAVTVALSTRRDRAFVTFDGVNRELEPRLIGAVRRVARRPRHVHFALGPRRCRAWLPVLAALRARGVSSSWDFGWNERLPGDPDFNRLLAAVDWIFVNEREALLYGRVRSIAASIGRWRTLASSTVIKRGAGGAIALSDGREERRAAERSTVVDTTGAGDAFNAGFLVAWLARASLNEALRLGNHIGARSTRAVGGIAGIPRRADLPAWAHRIIGST
jgi:ribokinase